MIIIVLQLGGQPFLDRPVLVDHVGRHLGQHFFPDRNPVRVDSQKPGGGDRVVQKLLGRRHVHGGVERHLGSRIPGRILGRLRGAEDISSIGTFIKIIFEEQGGLFHERQGVPGQERPVPRVEEIIIEEMGGPGGPGHPELPGEIHGEGVVEAVGRAAGRELDPPRPEDPPGVDLQIGDQPFHVRRVSRHELGHVAHEQAGDGRGDVAVLGEITGPGRVIGSGPDALQRRRQIAGAGDDVIASGVEDLFDERPRRQGVGRLSQKLFRGQAAIRSAAEVEAHPPEDRAVDLLVPGEQAGIVGGQPLQTGFRLGNPAFVELVEKADIDEDQDFVRAGDSDRRTVDHSRAVPGDDPGRAFQPLNAAGIGVDESAPVIQKILVGARRHVVDAGLEARVMRFAGGQLQPAADVAPARARNRKDGDSVGPGDKQPALVDAPAVGPVDRRFAGPEIRGPGIVRDPALRDHLDPEIEGRHERIGVAEVLLFGEVDGQLAGLVVEAAVDQPADLEQARPGRGRLERGPFRQEQALVAENDDLLEGPAQDARADSPVPAEEPLLPGRRRLGADEASLRNGQGPVFGQRWTCSASGRRRENRCRA